MALFLLFFYTSYDIYLFLVEYLFLVVSMFLVVTIFLFVGKSTD